MEFTRVRIKCDNPLCGRFFFANKSMYRDQQYKFCKICKRHHSYKVLVHQAIYGVGVEDRMISMAQVFKAPYVLADALEISPPTLYRWLRHYFRMSFVDFRDVYVLNKARPGVIRPALIAEFKASIVKLSPFDFRSLGVIRDGINYDVLPPVPSKFPA